jgi:hypothetical protein
VPARADQPTETASKKQPGGRGRKGGIKQLSREIGQPESTIRDAIRAADEADAARGSSSTPRPPRAKLNKATKAILDEGEVSDAETGKRIAKLPETEQVRAAEEVVTQQRAERMAEGREIAKWFIRRVGVDERQDLIDKVKRLRQAPWGVFDGFADALDDEAPAGEQPKAA